MRIRKLLLCFVLFGVSAAAVHAQNPAVKDSFTFEYTNDGRAIILDLLVNDTMKMKVMFDTGAIGFLPADSLAISDQTFKNPTTLRLSERTVKEYYEYPDGSSLDYVSHKIPIFKVLGIGGVLGWNFFENMIVSFSIDKREGLIFDRLPDDISDFSKVPMTKDERHWSIPVEISYKGVLMKENLLVDTGASGTATLNNGIVEKYNLVIDVIREGSTATSGGVERRNVMNADEVTVGDFHIYNRSVAIRPPGRSTPFSGIIGMSFLEDFDMIFDFKEGNLYLKKVD